MNRLTITAITAVLGVVIAAAQIPLPPPLDVRGNVPSASILSYDMNGQVEATLTPVEYSGRPAYFLRVMLFRTWMMGNEQIQLQAIAPANALRKRGSDTYDVDLDLPQLTTVMMLSAMRCDWTDWVNPCTMYTPSSLPVRGVLAPYSGMNSTFTRTTGQYQTISRTQMYIQEIKGSGGRTTQTATFTGVVGPASLGPNAWGSNATISEFTGNSKLTSTPLMP